MDLENSAPQQLIAERYKLTEKTQLTYTAPQISSWIAHDTVLSRQLRAIVINSDNPNRAAAVDGARRASLFTDTHAVSIISIEDSPENTVIFTEFPLGTRLFDVLSDFQRNISPRETNRDLDHSENDIVFSGKDIPASFVHAVLGQLSRVITNARHFGIRSLHLSADSIYLTDSDQVIVDGLGVLGPLHGASFNRSSEELDRSEARGLVVFLASLLLARDFPADPAEHDSIVYQAREKAVNGRYAQQLIDVLNNEVNGNGPQSAGDFMRLLAPWDDSLISSYLAALPTGGKTGAKSGVSAPGAPQHDSGVPVTAQNSLSAAESDRTELLHPGFPLDLAAADSAALSSAPAWPSLRDTAASDFTPAAQESLNQDPADAAETKNAAETADSFVDFSAAEAEMQPETEPGTKSAADIEMEENQEVSNPEDSAAKTAIAAETDAAAEMSTAAADEETLSVPSENLSAVSAISQNDSVPEINPDSNSDLNQEQIPETTQKNTAFPETVNPEIDHPSSASEIEPENTVFPPVAANEIIAAAHPDTASENAYPNVDSAPAKAETDQKPDNSGGKNKNLLPHSQQFLFQIPSIQKEPQKDQRKDQRAEHCSGK
ncbi:hypothetical protein RQN30_07745 [Arcanobacterium hippocoleae]